MSYRIAAHTDLFKQPVFDPEVKVGDKVVVFGLSGINWDIKVSKITKTEDKRTQITLDWGVHGESRVWLHDHNQTWKLKSDVN